MNTFQTLTRWLTPWRTIRRLEAENQRLESSLAKSTLQIIQPKEQAALRAQINLESRKLIECQYKQLMTMGEGFWRLRKYGWDGVVAQPVYDWIRDGMTGPLPPLPDHIAKREQPTTEDQP